MFGVIRIKGVIHISPEFKTTLNLLRLNRVNHLVLVNDTPSIRGMLKIVEHLVTYGEIDENMISTLLMKRGRLTGDKRLSEEFFKENKTTLSGFVSDLVKGNKKLSDLGIKPVFRLSPPSKGFKARKHPFVLGGDYGFRSTGIGSLVERMI